MSQNGGLIDGLCTCNDSTYWELAASVKKISLMSKDTTLFKKIFDADTQSLVEAGFLDASGITVEGRSELEAIVFDQNKAALVAVAKEKLAAAKK